MEKIYEQKDVREFLSKKLVGISKDFKENNIEWWAKGGTIIGAIRHKDIIPWDDDVDMGMELMTFVNNKDKIKEIVDKHDFTLFDKYSKEGKGITYLKLTYKDKMVVEFAGKKYQFRPFIDVMLASSVKGESNKETLTWKYANHFKHLYSSWYAPFPRYRYDFKENENIKQRTLIAILIFPLTSIVRIIIPSFIYRKIMYKIDLRRERKNEGSKYIAYNYSYRKPQRNMLLRRGIEWVEFGEGEIPLSVDYKKELDYIFGDISMPDSKHQYPSHYTVTPYNYKKGKAKLSPYSFK